MTHELEICVFSNKVVKSVELSIGNPRIDTISGYFSSWIYEEFCWLSEENYAKNADESRHFERRACLFCTNHTSYLSSGHMTSTSTRLTECSSQPIYYHILSFIIYSTSSRICRVLWWGQKQIPHPRLHSSSTILHSICAVGAYGVVFYTRGMKLLQEHARHCSLFFRPSKFLDTFDRAHHF